MVRSLRRRRLARLKARETRLDAQERDEEWLQERRFLHLQHAVFSGHDYQEAVDQWDRMSLQERERWGFQWDQDLEEQVQLYRTLDSDRRYELPDELLEPWFERQFQELRDERGAAAAKEELRAEFWEDIRKGREALQEQLEATRLLFLTDAVLSGQQYQAAMDHWQRLSPGASIQVLVDPRPVAGTVALR
jgi:hypothetical protein